MSGRHRITNPDPDRRTGECSICGPVKISRAGVYKDRPVWRCAPGTNRRMLARYHSDPDRYTRQGRFQRLYGITLEEYNQRLEEQNGLCARCQQPPGQLRLAVDHCHKTGRIRGLLCGPCNTYLGRLEANLDRLVEDLKYVDPYFADVILARMKG